MSIDKIFTEDQLRQADQLTVQQAQTCIFYNAGKGRFTMVPLPIRAQFSPVFAALATDLNRDGIKDIFLGGNFYGLKPETGRFDASYGVSFLADTQHRLTYSDPAITGLFIKGEVRDIKEIETNNGNCIIVARNNEALQVFRKNK